MNRVGLELVWSTHSQLEFLALSEQKGHTSKMKLVNDFTRKLTS